MKRLTLITAIVASVLFLNESAHSSYVPDEQWFAPVDRTRGGLVGFDFSEGFEFQRITTNMSPNFPAGMQVINSDGTSNLPKVCNGVNDPSCSKAISFVYHAVFPVCDSSRMFDCIESLWAEIDGKIILGKYVENIPAIPTTPYSDEGATNLITGSTPSLWQIPGVIHGGGKDTYVVNTLIAQASDSAGTPVKFNTGGTFRAGISPVNLIRGNYPSMIAGKEFPTGDEYRVCATYGDGVCAQKQAFPQATRFGLSIRMSQSPIGWLHGRFKAPVASIENLSRGTRVSLTGEPVKVPTIAGMFPLTDYSPEFQKSHKEDEGYLLMKRRGGTVGSYGYFMQGSNPNNVVYEPSLSGTTSSLKLVLPLMKEKSSAEPTVWKFSTLSGFSDNNVTKCVNESQKLAGIVSTNSTTYSDGPPSFNQESQSLDYELASAHYTSKGEEFTGTYDLLMDASVARCIYGFAKTPTSATISIVKGDTVEKVSTTTLTEKNGWLSLAAYGFTFSSPKISVKLNQPKEEAPVKVETSTTTKPVVNQPIMKSIYCANSKGRKTVKGVNPKCPKGYKLVK